MEKEGEINETLEGVQIKQELDHIGEGSSTEYANLPYLISNQIKSEMCETNKVKEEPKENNDVYVKDGLDNDVYVKDGLENVSVKRKSKFRDHGETEDIVKEKDDMMEHEPYDLIEYQICSNQDACCNDRVRVLIRDETDRELMANITSNARRLAVHVKKLDQGGTPMAEPIIIYNIPIEKSSSTNIDASGDEYFGLTDFEGCFADIFLDNTLTSNVKDCRTPLLTSDTCNITIDVSKSTKERRRRDKLFACAYCKKLMTNIRVHYLRSHKDKDGVQEIERHPVGSEERSQALMKLRNIGNFKHNISVLKEREGCLIVSKRPTSKSNNYSDYIPCRHCYGFYYKNDLKRHAPFCPLRMSQNVPTK